MSVVVTNCDPVSTLSPLENFISSKPVDDNVTLNKRLRDIDNRIETWQKIASNEKIDIIEEDTFLSSLTPGNEECLPLFKLLLMERCKERTCSCIVRKVKRNLRREPKRDVMEALERDLHNLTNHILLPWIKVAVEEGADIKEEKGDLNTVDKDSYDTLAESGANSRHILEVVQRRLKEVRLIYTQDIIRKVYLNRIKEITEKTKSLDWFDEERISIINGIAKDAMADLPSSRYPNPIPATEMKDKCEIVFGIFKLNIELFNTNPAEYHEVADKEELKRNILNTTNKVLQICMAQRNITLGVEIATARREVLGLLTKENDTESIRTIVNKIFRLYFERIGGNSISGTCGSLNDGSILNQSDPAT